MALTLFKLESLPSDLLNLISSKYISGSDSAQLTSTSTSLYNSIDQNSIDSSINILKDILKDGYNHKNAYNKVTQIVDQFYDNKYFRRWLVGTRYEHWSLTNIFTRAAMFGFDQLIILLLEMIDDKELQQYGYDINTIELNFMFAISLDNSKNGQSAKVFEIILNRLNSDARIRYKNVIYQAFLHSSTRGYIHEVQVFLKHNINPVADGRNHMLFWTVYYGHVDVVKLLLSYDSTSIQTKNEMKRVIKQIRENRTREMNQIRNVIHKYNVVNY